MRVAFRMCPIERILRDVTHLEQPVGAHPETSSPKIMRPLHAFLHESCQRYSPISGLVAHDLRPPSGPDSAIAAWRFAILGVQTTSSAICKRGWKATKCSPKGPFRITNAMALDTVGHSSILLRARKKPININIFGWMVSGTNRNRPWDKWDPSPGQNGTRPWDKPAFLCLITQ